MKFIYNNHICTKLSNLYTFPLSTSHKTSHSGSSNFSIAIIVAIYSSERSVHIDSIVAEATESPRASTVSFHWLFGRTLRFGYIIAFFTSKYIHHSLDVDPYPFLNLNNLTLCILAMRAEINRGIAAALQV